MNFLWLRRRLDPVEHLFHRQNVRRVLGRERYGTITAGVALRHLGASDVDTFWGPTALLSPRQDRRPAFCGNGSNGETSGLTSVHFVRTTRLKCVRMCVIY